MEGVEGVAAGGDSSIASSIADDAAAGSVGARRRQMVAGESRKTTFAKLSSGQTFRFRLRALNGSGIHPIDTYNQPINTHNQPVKTYT